MSSSFTDFGLGPKSVKIRENGIESKSSNIRDLHFMVFSWNQPQTTAVSSTTIVIIAYCQRRFRQMPGRVHPPIDRGRIRRHNSAALYY